MPFGEFFGHLINHGVLENVGSSLFWLTFLTRLGDHFNDVKADYSCHLASVARKMLTAFSLGVREDFYSTWIHYYIMHAVHKWS